MAKTRLSLLVCAHLTAIAGFAQSSYVFQLPGQAVNQQAPQIEGLGDNDFSRILGPANNASYQGATKIIATPNGNKFYILTTAGMFAAGRTTLNSPTPLSAIAGAVSDAQITPDGKYLFVVANHLYIVDIATDSLAAESDTGVSPGATPVAVALSHDSKTAWILSTSNAGSTLIAVDLTGTAPHTTANQLSLLSQATSVVLSPRGFLYVTSGNHLYEIDPLTLAVTNLGDMQVAGQAGPIQFTPDGNNAYFVNLSTSGAPLFRLTVQAHSVTPLAPTADGSTPPPVDRVLVAGNNRVFALSSATRILYDVSPSPFALTPAVIGVLPTSNVVAATVSNEVPSSRYLYLLFSDLNFYAVNLANNRVDLTFTLDPAKGSILSFVSIPAQSGADHLSVINASQTVAPNTPVLLVGQVLDSVGRPVMGASASFSADGTSGITITNPSIVTTAGGWAQTMVTAPAAAGNYTVNLSSPGLSSVSFAITVSTGSGGNTGGSGTPTMSIVAGDGELLRQNQSTNSTDTHVPLTVKIVDENGNPLSNVSVTFAVETGGIGFLTPRNQGLTDQDGLARADYVSASLPSNTSILLTKVQASSIYGSVEFYEVTHDALLNDVQPVSEILTPANSRTITVPQGGVLPAGIAVHTYAEKNVANIPNVGLRLADTNTPSIQSPVASCQGFSRADSNGISRCDVLAACQLDAFLPHDFGAFLYVGEHQGFSLTIRVTQGTASLLKPVSDLNQSGKSGGSFTLLARVTDGCGLPVAADGLSWEVIPGSASASLSQAQTSSDTSGNVSAQVTLGQTAGVVQVKLSGAGLAPIIFNITNQVTVSGIFPVSGGGQSVVIGQPFPQPVIFLVRDGSGKPVQGAQVNFSVTGGASLNPGSATSDAQGRVQTAVTAGSTAGSIVVTATVGNFSATATLSAHAAGPQLLPTSFTNAASGAGGMTPCGFVTVAGSGVASGVQGVVTAFSFFGAYPYSLAGISITVNDIPVPIQAVANDQFGERVNFQAPCELTGSSATVVVSVSGATTTVTGVPVFAVQPGIFTYTGPNNKVYGGVIREVDGTYVTAANPAHPGEKVYVVVTGLGQATPALITNSAGTGSQNVNLPTAVFLSGTGFPALSARYMFGWVGAYLIEFQIPKDSPTGPDQKLLVVETSPDGNDFLGVSNTVLLPAVQ